MEQHSLNPGVNVYQGFWRDWTKGSLWGCTLTLGPTSAAVLSNSIAVFITICGRQLWTIVRYIIHQRGVSLQSTARTPHLSKEQLVLRNAGSAVETAYNFFGLAWTSRKSSGQRSLRSYTIAVWAIIYALAFLVASAFSSQVISGASTNNGSEVLVQSDQCSLWNPTEDKLMQAFNVRSARDFAMYTQFVAPKIADFQLSLIYARDCYMSEEPTIDMSYTCHTFKKPKLGWQLPSVGNCPFDHHLCQNSSNVILLDTGNISSSQDFGINAAISDQLTYRSVTTCAVLNGSAYISNSSTSTHDQSDTADSSHIAYAYYGPSTREHTDWTYSFSNLASQYSNFTAYSHSPYQLDVEQAYAITTPQWSSSDFEPISGLRQEDADVSLIFLSFTGMYLEQVNDPWFAAHQEQQFNSTLPFLNSRFAADMAINTIGCTEQHNFCTSNGTCTGMQGFDQVQNVNAFNAALTLYQNATFNRILQALSWSRLSNVLQFLASAPLLANNLTITGKSGAVLSLPVSDDQWITELEYWHAYSMAHFQRTLVQLASGQFYPSNNSWTVPATDPQDLWFCRSLIIPSAFYQSYNVAALVTIIVCGILILLLSAFIKESSNLIRRWLNRPRSLGYWDHDDVLEQGMRRIDDQSYKSKSGISASTKRKSEGLDLTPCPGHWRSQLNFTQGIMLHLPTQKSCRLCAGSGSEDSQPENLDKI